MTDISSYKCCDRQSLAIMDYTWPMFKNQLEEGEIQQTKINRLCMHCFAHWFGTEGDVKQYTKAEWNAMVEGAL